MIFSLNQEYCSLHTSLFKLKHLLIVIFKIKFVINQALFIYVEGDFISHQCISLGKILQFQYD